MGWWIEDRGNWNLLYSRCVAIFSLMLFSKSSLVYFSICEMKEKVKMRKNQIKFVNLMKKFPFQLSLKLVFWFFLYIFQSFLRFCDDYSNLSKDWFYLSLSLSAATNCFKNYFLCQNTYIIEFCWKISFL